jgi:uncharacterized protein YutE (UPF0331/DUF86 family)
MLKPERLLAYAREFLHVAVSEDSVQNVEMVEAQLGSDEEFHLLKELAESNATAAVLRAWQLVEFAVDRALPTEYQPRSRTVAQSLGPLVELKIISQKAARSMKDLNLLRNQIVHEDGSQLTSISALAFVSAAKSIVDTLARSSTPQAMAQRYEESVHEALLFHDFAVRVLRGAADRGYDFLVRAADEERVVAVVVKYSRVGPFAGYQLKEQLAHFSLPGESVLSLLIVTNAPLSAEVRKFNSGIHADAHPSSAESRLVQVVQWVGPADSHHLVEAIDKLARRD